MNEIEKIQYRIHEIRGQKVMLDFDLATLYGIETRVLNQAVKRNIERFPEDFMFQLTKGELDLLRSQFVISKTDDTQEDTDWKSQIVISNFSKMGTRKLPYAFTENGVAMLSSVLRSPLAIQMNIGIMRVFTEIRRMASALALPDNNAELRREIQALRDEMNEILADQNEINEDTRAQLDAISTALADLQQDKRRHQIRRTIGFIQPDKEKS
jgi:ORF6N domain.